MYRFYLALVDILPAAACLVPLFFVLYLTAYRRDLKKSCLYCLFCLYMAAVFSLVGIPNVRYFRPEVNLNLIPFAGMMADLKNGILNVLLFLPMGFFLALLWQRFRSPGRCLVFGFGMSLTIELLQLLTFRATDVNDLILNTLGILPGYFLAKALWGRVDSAGAGRGDPYLLTALSLGVMFFLHPFLSPILWDRIL